MIPRKSYIVVETKEYHISPGVNSQYIFALASLFFIYGKQSCSDFTWLVECKYSNFPYCHYEKTRDDDDGHTIFSFREK